LTRIIELADGQNRCSLVPELGGSIAGWAVSGQNMLRQASPAALGSGDRLGLSSFPLVPYSNRIDHGRFVWNERIIQIAPNFAPEPHAIHGTGWEDRWQVTEVSASAVTLTLDHQADPRWPWPFAARQQISVADSSLTIAMEARNMSSKPAPLGFGHHPYFDAEGASLNFRARQVWLNGADCLPSESVIPAGDYDFSQTGELADRSIDHCYTGWDGQAQIRWAGRPLALTIVSDMNAAIAYVPRGEAYFCFEPVPHSNNALNRSDADPKMPVIEPGAKFQSVIRFLTAPAA
jgi:aldose 1-epimerase